MIVIDKDVLLKFGSSVAVMWGHIKEQQKLQGGVDEILYTQDSVFKELGYGSNRQIRVLDKLEKSGYISKKTYGLPPNRHVIIKR